MSTRAHIRIIEGNDTFLLYHHHDGYPEGVGSDLKQFLSQRRWWYADEIANDLIKGKLDKDDEYEIASCLHGDEAYIYVINCDDRTLKCYGHNFDEDYETSVRSKEINIPDK